MSTCSADVMERAPFIPIGRIIKAHGLKGEVSVGPLTGPPFFMPVGLEVWLVPPPGSSGSMRVEAVRPGPKGPLVKLDGIGSIEQARAVVGAQILARGDDVPESSDDDLYDVEGFAVHTDSGLDLGVVEETIITGANDVWIVRGRYGDVLLPVIDDVVLEVDVDACSIVVHLLPGLVGLE